MDNEETTAGEAAFFTAKDKLEAAIKEFYRETDPDAYVSAWILVAHKESVSLAADNVSAVSHIVPTGQSWPMSLGMAVVVSDNLRSMSREY